MLLLATLFDLEDGRLDSGKVKAFLLMPGEAIEVYGTTLHYCNRYTRTTALNAGMPAEGHQYPPPPPPRGQAPYRQQQVLLAHESCPEIGVPAIFGENWEVKY